MTAQVSKLLVVYHHHQQHLIDHLDLPITLIKYDHQAALAFHLDHAQRSIKLELMAVKPFKDHARKVIYITTPHTTKTYPAAGAKVKTSPKSSAAGLPYSEKADIPGYEHER